MPKPLALTKADLAATVYENIAGLTRLVAAEVDAVFETMKQMIAGSEKVKISRFGNFVTRGKKLRSGRNPQTGRAITIAARRVVRFQPSRILKDVVNN